MTTAGTIFFFFRSVVRLYSLEEDEKRRKKKEKKEKLKLKAVSGLKPQFYLSSLKVTLTDWFNLAEVDRAGTPELTLGYVEVIKVCDVYSLISKSLF